LSTLELDNALHRLSFAELYGRILQESGYNNKRDDFLGLQIGYKFEM